MWLPPTVVHAPSALGLTGEQELALAVIEDAWKRWTSGKGSARERRQLEEFLVGAGGGLWADWLNVDPDVVRQAAARVATATATDPEFYAVEILCAGCEAPAIVHVRNKHARPKYCLPCRQKTWPRSVQADAARLARVRTSRWPEMADRRHWWK